MTYLTQSRCAAAISALVIGSKMRSEIFSSNLHLLRMHRSWALISRQPGYNPKFRIFLSPFRFQRAPRHRSFRSRCARGDTGRARLVNFNHAPHYPDSNLGSIFKDQVFGPPVYPLVLPTTTMVIAMAKMARPKRQKHLLLKTVIVMFYLD